MAYYTGGNDTQIWDGGVKVRATVLEHLEAKVSPQDIRAIYEQPAPRRVWHWNRAKLYDSLLQIVGIVAVGLFVAYMVVGWIMGTWN